MPDNVQRVKRYRDDIPLFSRLRLGRNAWQQVIVQALAGMFGVDLDHPDGGGLQGRKFLCALRKATYNRDSLKGLN